jgi:hypothetical protein
LELFDAFDGDSGTEIEAVEAFVVELLVVELGKQSVKQKARHNVARDLLNSE